VNVQTYGTCSASFGTGTVTVTPSGSGAGTAGVMLGEVIPGDIVKSNTVAADMTDNYPCPMEAQSLYLITFAMSAPSTAAQNAPADVMWIGASSETDELTNLNYVTLQGGHHAMPKTGTAQNYYALFASNYATAALTDADPNNNWVSCFRPRFMWGNNVPLGGSGEPNSGGITISGIKVQKVTVTGAN